MNKNDNHFEVCSVKGAFIISTKNIDLCQPEQSAVCARCHESEPCILLVIFLTCPKPILPNRFSLLLD